MTAAVAQREITAIAQYLVAAAKIDLASSINMDMEQEIIIAYGSFLLLYLFSSSLETAMTRTKFKILSN